MSQKFPGQCIHVKLHLSIYSFQKNSWGGGGGGGGWGMPPEPTKKIVVFGRSVLLPQA